MSEFEPILLTLSSLTPSLAVEVLPHGLTLHRIFVQADGRTHDIVIGPELPQDHLTQKYTNTVVGRYANRIPVGLHRLERKGIVSQFAAAANENPRVSLHGGPAGFDYQKWSLLSSEQSSILFSAAELSHISASSPSSSAIFRLISPDGDQGYPGELIVEALVALIGNVEHDISPPLPGNTTEQSQDLGSILLVYRAKLNEGDKKVVTPVNITQHWGFNLDASLKDGPDSTSVEDHLLTISADHIIERDVDSLSTGTFLPTTAIPAHRHFSNPIKDNIPESGYDDYYLFKSRKTPPTRFALSSFDASFDLIGDLLQPSPSGRSADGEQPVEPVVKLYSPKSGISLTFDTNQQGVMFYSNNLAKPSAGARKKIHGGSGISGHGDSYAPGSAAFLEFHNPLAAFLHAADKDTEDTLLTSDELYHNYVRCNIRFGGLKH
ncbi:galactose mutarotase-like domain-containing protein [Infundibulicybe gibba]|nr:galactose mutarotase-like domain-containing protein [Infundibulicybe gibba]